MPEMPETLASKARLSWGGWVSEWVSQRVTKGFLRHPSQVSNKCYDQWPVHDESKTSFVPGMLTRPEHSKNENETGATVKFNMWYSETKRTIAYGSSVQFSSGASYTCFGCRCSKCTQGVARSFNQSINRKNRMAPPAQSWTAALNN